MTNICKKNVSVNAGRAQRKQQQAVQQITIWGLHAVAAAIANPNRVIQRLLLTRNAARKIGLEPANLPAHAELVSPQTLAASLPAMAVHQGAAAMALPLPTVPLAEIGAPGPVLVLDDITDPQNIGAIFRSAAAFGATAIIMRQRGIPELTGAAIKAASGAVEQVREVRVVNIARALDALADSGWCTIGLGSEFPLDLSAAIGSNDQPLALVLGAEGHGLRSKVGAACLMRARIDLPGGGISSLNVSNAAAIALYAARLKTHRDPEFAP